jgi:hypothetical protein
MIEDCYIVNDRLNHLCEYRSKKSCQMATVNILNLVMIDRLDVLAKLGSQSQQLS